MAAARPAVAAESREVTAVTAVTVAAVAAADAALSLEETEIGWCTHTTSGDCNHRARHRSLLMVSRIDRRQ
jgi:hypothetical protein